jgi:large subunit ribosomal protein L22
VAKTKVHAGPEVRAQAKWVHCSARKARLVLDTIRSRSVPEARTVLAFSNRAVAREIDKVLHSAVANAEANHGYVGDDMFISACYADEGPGLKRWKPRARGRADRLVKGSCHITIRLASLTPPVATVNPPTPVAAAEPSVAEPAASSEAVVTAPAAPEPGTGEVKPTGEATGVKPKAAAKKTAAKPSAAKSEQGEAKPKTATRRAPKPKKAEE